MNIEERVEAYNKTFAKWPASHLHYQGGFIIGVWMIGNYYKNASPLYGAYPHSYLERIKSMFTDIHPTRILHLFSGSVVDYWGTTFDINDELNSPEVVGDAHELSKYFKEETFDLILADPPYSSEDAEHYGTPMINRNKVVKECYKVLKTGGFLIWLDQTYPMYRKDELKLVGTIGLIRSTNHRVRMVFIYQKVGGAVE